MKRAAFLALSAIGLLAAAEDPYPAPRFTDPQRRSKLEKAFPEVDKIFRDFAFSKAIPGMVWGVVIDGDLAHAGTFGVRDRKSGDAVTADTVFRIASMTKSFTTLCILKLRDEGRLSLEDPVAKWIPEFEKMPLPVRDSAPIRVRDLLTHGAGFPEDNPWGDQQLRVSDEQLTGWLGKGIPFSNPPDTAYEYSNYGFGLLGRIVSKASGKPYREYLESEILKPLGMSSSTLEPSTLPAAIRATGYRKLPDGNYAEEPSLPHGAFGSMGGLLTPAKDLAKYVAFQLSAWPARNDSETGPVRRSSVREMNKLWRISNLSASRSSSGTLKAEARGYGYGLRISTDCRFEHVSGHGGGLPGFGSYMAWLPDHGVGLFVMANLTYAGPAQPLGEAWDAFLKTGGLRARELPVSPVLSRMKDSIMRLWNAWDDQEAQRIAAMNLFLDAPVRQRRAAIDKLKSEVGECSSAGPLQPETWLRGTFDLKCAKGDVSVVFTLAPTQPPALQFLSFERRKESKARLGAPTSPVNGISCAE